MIRKENWAENLQEYIDRVYDKPFEWGSHDCCHFASACVEAMTGEYPLKYKYKTKLGAMRLLKKMPLDKRLEDIFGQSIPLATAKRGDMVYHMFDNSPCVGVCIGKNSLFVGYNGGEGLVEFPTLLCIGAFKNG